MMDDCTSLEECIQWYLSPAERMATLLIQTCVSCIIWNRKTMPLMMIATHHAMVYSSHNQQMRGGTEMNGQPSN